MSKRDVGLYIEDIRIAIERIEKFTRGLSFEQFSSNAMVIDAVVRNIEIIGEASAHIPKDVQVKYPDVPWSLIAGTRNKAIHEYFAVDVKIIWKTTQEDLPKLKEQIMSMLQNLQI